MSERADDTPHPGEGANPEDRRVLVVEDHPVNRLVAVGMLRQLGYEATAVDNGVAAVEATAQEGFLAVLMDCQMPLLDGYDATRMIRAREAERGEPRLPIIALTASVGRQDRERAHAAGMDAFVTKPVPMEKLGEALAACLRGGDLHVHEERDPDLPVGFRRLVELEDLVGHGAMREIYDVFFDDSARTLGILDRALSERDASTFGTHAHGLKGSCANVGAESLKELALELERRAREGRLDGARPLLKRFRQQLTAARTRFSA